MPDVLFGLDVIQYVMRPERHQKYDTEDGSNKQQAKTAIQKHERE